MIVSPPRIDTAELDESLVADSGRALLACELTFADGSGEHRIPVWVAGQDQKMLPRRVGGPGTGKVHGSIVEGELGAENGRQADRSRCLGEADDAVEPVVVGEGQASQPQANRFLHQFLGV